MALTPKKGENPLDFLEFYANIISIKKATQNGFSP
jgi:hypothetical protein